MKFTFTFFVLINCFWLNAQYDINDPRNPNCPCHKYQKLADEEYKKLLAKAGSNKTEMEQNQLSKPNQEIVKNQNNSLASMNKHSGSGSKNIHSKKSLRRVLKRMLKKTALVYDRLNFGGGKKITDKCFSWN